MIELRRFTEEDFSRLQSWIKNEDELLQFAGAIFTFPITEEQLSVYINDNRRIPFKVSLRETSEVIGHCELNFENELPRLSRILIGEKQHRSKGYGKLIVKEMLNLIFNEYHFSSVDLNVFDWNLSAIKCYESLGFKVVPGNEKEFIRGNEIWKTINMIAFRP